MLTVAVVMAAMMVAIAMPAFAAPKSGAGSYGLRNAIDKQTERMLEEVAGAGLFAATIYQLWNRKLVESRPDIHGFEHWSEVPDLVLGALSKPAP